MPQTFSVAEVFTGTPGKYEAQADTVEALGRF